VAASLLVSQNSIRGGMGTFEHVAGPEVEFSFTQGLAEGGQGSFYVGGSGLFVWSSEVSSFMRPPGDTRIEATTLAANVVGDDGHLIRYPAAQTAHSTAFSVTKSTSSL
jgi:hypothetical protein